MGMAIKDDRFQNIFDQKNWMKGESERIHLRHNTQPDTFSTSSKNKNRNETSRKGGYNRKSQSTDRLVRANCSNNENKRKERLCVDLKRINHEVKHELYMLPNLRSYSAKSERGYCFIQARCDQWFSSNPFWEIQSSTYDSRWWDVFAINGYSLEYHRHLRYTSDVCRSY